MNALRRSSSIAARLDRLDARIEAGMGQVRRPIASDPAPRRTFAPVRGITGFGEGSAAIASAESPDVADFTPEALAAFAGLSPSEHSYRPCGPSAKQRSAEPIEGSSVRGPGKVGRIGGRRPRGLLDMCALGARRTDKALADFVRRMTAAGKPPEVILVAVEGALRAPCLRRIAKRSRKLSVYAHAVIRTRKPFPSSPEAPSPA